MERALKSRRRKGWQEGSVRVEKLDEEVMVNAHAICIDSLRLIKLLSLGPQKGRLMADPSRSFNA